MDVLARFAAEHGITYDLLSDVESMTIEGLGLLNEHLAEQQAYYGFEVGDRHRGLPYPGTLVLDSDGIVTRRLFDQTYRERPSPGVLLREASDRSPKPERSTSLETPVVKVSAWFDAPNFWPMQRVELTVRLDIAGDWHVYVAPVPQGFTALNLTLGPTESLTQAPAQVPRGRPFTVEGLDERFDVVEGAVDITVPVLLHGAGFLADGSNRPDPAELGPLEVAVEISFQACSPTECLPPETHVLHMSIDEDGQVGAT